MHALPALAGFAAVVRKEGVTLRTKSLRPRQFERPGSCHMGRRHELRTGAAFIAAGTPVSSVLLRASTLLNAPDFSGRIAYFFCLALSGPADLGG